MSILADPRTNLIMSGGVPYTPPTAEEERQRLAQIQQYQQQMREDPMAEMRRAQGMMSRPPTGGGLRELTPRQQRRQQYLQARGREFRPNQRVQAQPTEMPQQELTARQQRRQQYLQRRDARRERAVADYRAQQQAPQGLDPFANVITGQRQQDTPGLPVDMSAIVPYSQDLAQQFGQQFGNMQTQPAMAPLPPGMTAGQLSRAITGQGMGMVAGGDPNAFTPQIGNVPQGMSIEQYQQQTPSPAFVNQMPGQLRTGTFTPQGMYRPLPFYASPQQIRERQALIETGGYFDQPTPAQRMR